ncbi:MAG: rhodanese-like domain-containing protein [Acidobacteriota bacterium]
MALLALLLAAGALGACRSGGTPEADTRMRGGDAAPAPGGIRFVRPAVAFEILRDNPELLVLDLRPASAFRSGHLFGAVHVPLGRLRTLLREITDLRRRAILLYCDNDACHRRGIEILAEEGVRYAFVVEGGIDAWQAAGYGVLQPPEPAP